MIMYGRPCESSFRPLIQALLFLKVGNVSIWLGDHIVEDPSK